MRDLVASFIIRLLIINSCLNKGDKKMTKRLKLLQQTLKQEKTDALLVTNLFNLRYLSGFTGTTAVGLVTPNTAFLITDSRYTIQATNEAKHFEVITHGSIWEDAVKELIDRLEITKLAIDGNNISYNQYLKMSKMFDASLVVSSPLIEKQREVKDKEEIETIQKACKIADIAFDRILTYVKPGMTEIEVANELDFVMRRYKATGVSFDTIVASGLRSALPHGVATHKIIEENDIITIDFGCYYNGYVSDITRTISIGSVMPTLKKMHAAVLESNQKTIKAIKPGITSKELIEISRKVLRKYDLEQYFTHGLGHGIGLEIHEGPMLSLSNDKPLVPGNIITIEPGCYIDGIGGVRIEDDVLVTDQGFKVLTHSSHDLLEL